MIVGFAGATPAASAAAPQAKWTVMVYISGDNNLEDYVVKDLELELAAAGSNADVQIVALADRGPGYDTSRGDWQTTKLFHVTPGMTADAASAVADWGERNMRDKQTLTDFVSWGKANYPADHYALYFWGHGDVFLKQLKAAPTMSADQLAINSSASTVVLHERHTGQYAGSHGITIYGPASKNQKIDYAYYRTLDLSLHTNWDEFLGAFVP
jgi:hypothetical protein